MRVTLIKSNPSYWHHKYVGEVFDVRESREDSDYYELIDTPRNAALTGRSSSALARHDIYIAKKNTAPFAPTSNREALVLIEHED